MVVVLRDAVELCSTGQPHSAPLVLGSIRAGCGRLFLHVPRYTERVETHVKPDAILREMTTQSPEETIAFGRTLAELLAPPKLVLLRGDLGAGKTTLVKGIAAAVEAAEEEDVTSPTFTLIHEYRGPRANLYHIDLYRIDTQRELDTLALDDLRAENSILLIEWGEKFPRFVRERDVEIALEREGENGRRIRVSS
jgi:tRNA threonylcarbamoyladenosine biosynthesis protein TsaE